MLVFNGETQKGNNNAGLEQCGATQPTLASQSFKVMKALLSLPSIPILLLAADILHPLPPSDSEQVHKQEKTTINTS